MPRGGASCVGMKRSLVVTILGPDRPGLVQALSEVVADAGGNWLESRMARMAGRFAGILRVECEDAAVAALEQAVQRVEGLSVQLQRVEPEDPAGRQSMEIDVVGNDRPGIIRELSAAIAGAGGNVEELSTTLESAAMAGHPIFHARGVVSLGEAEGAERLVAAIEELGEDLAVTVGEG